MLLLNLFRKIKRDCSEHKILNFQCTQSNCHLIYIPVSQILPTELIINNIYFEIYK